ncbi:MAG: hypothetical protein QOF71_3351 [Candidatus Eremiobacteraeota bacterium]|nr:hypothetical protein [Candidatus Eremiobacteraeota bacterium]
MQNTELRQTELRPLGAGELLDRAVTLFVRDFVPIVTVLAVVIVPIVALSAIVAPKSGQVFADLGRIFSAAGNRGATEAATAALSRDSGSSALQFLVSAAGIVARLLMWSAIVALVASAYAGSRITFGQAYRVGVQRWLQQVVVALTFFVLGAVTAVPLVLSYLLVAIVIGVLAGFNQFIAAVAAGIVGGLIVIGGFAVVLSWVFMMYELAAVAVVTETSNPVEAIGIGLRRGFARGMRVRTIVGGLVVFVVSYVGSLPLIAVAVTLTALTHVDVLYFAVLGVGSVLLEGIVAAFVVVFAVDVRVRREGFDIIAAEPPPLLQ